MVRVIPMITKQGYNQQNESWYRQQCILHIPFTKDEKQLLKKLPNSNMIKTSKWEKVYLYNNLQISEIELINLKNEDILPENADKGIIRDNFEINSSYTNKPKLEKIGMMAKDITYDWIKNSKQFPKYEECKNFCKKYKNQSIIKDKNKTSLKLTLTSEQLDILNIIDNQINYIKSRKMDEILKDTNNKIIRRVIIQGKAGN